MLVSSFNTSDFTTSDNKSVYKDSKTGPDENDSNRVNQTSRDIHNIARVRAKVHETVTLHGKVVAKRMQMRELHSNMKQKCEEELRQRVALMQEINRFCAHIEAQRDSRTIEASHGQLQSTTDAYMELQQRYDAADNELQQCEFDFDLAMERLAVLLGETDIADQEEGDQSMGSLDADAHSYDTISFSDTMHPHMIEYLERMGDVEIYEEQLWEIYQEYYGVLEKREVRRRVNLPLDEESQEFLASYDEERTNAERQLDHAVSEANRLKKLCESQGLFDDIPGDSNNNNNQNSNDIAVVDNDEIGLSEAIQDHQQQPKDPLKATMEEDTQPFFEPQDSSASPSGKFDRCTFINKWLLHQLRHSSLQISRLKALPELQHLATHDTDDISISQQALDVWYTDDSEMVEAPVSPSITEHTGLSITEDASPSVTEYAEAGDGGSTVTAPGNDSQGFPRGTDSGVLVARRKSEPLKRAERWVSEGEWRARKSCTIL